MTDLKSCPLCGNSGWIPVSEKLPEPDEIVEVYARQHMYYPARFCKDYFQPTSFDPSVWLADVDISYEEGEFFVNDVTHWRYPVLPEPPQQSQPEYTKSRYS
jgi:hypothetical protein